jgi:hypothetical protein
VNRTFLSHVLGNVVAMYVLTATNDTQGLIGGDYGFTTEGELVALPLTECDAPRCGCNRGWAGLSSRRATTTAIVSERPDLDRAAYRQLIIDHWSEQFPGASPGADPEFVREIDEFVNVVQNLGVGFGAGAVVRRRPGGKLGITLRPAA